ncbi:hypothetical protein ABIE44_000093 [Marmoricola sp. OAE513]|uniref:hypothetical protein n=1 Tax=Marmoricola sp. OAE513 TaxID=2817894 RepID=UPI001AEA6FF9
MLNPGRSQRRLVAVVLVSLVVVPLVVSRSGSSARAELCAKPTVALRIGDSIACVHSDEAPPGVDVTERPSTADLKERPGAGEAAYEAAADLGVPTPTEVATTATGPAVECDGDGQSGYRVQAMYVVEASKTNRFASLLPSFRLWAAGTDDVVNRSAALTGGVRHIRYVTDAGSGGTCVANVLNVTVPAGSMSSFGTTVAAVQALGYTNPARKYLMWTDATVLCGVASMYTSDGAAQSNPNNGSYAQYARVDAGCWGLGNGSGEHSVEAHELMHTFGGVQATAPHSTKVGHCWDESDTMCYADGGTFAMKQICPSAKEYFFDCNNDDYFSTFPATGSYLATHWNSADSRFLIGGGNGSGGGTPGAPTVLGATVSVNNPAVPGLATQVSVAPQLPTGRTLTKVAWTSKRADCAFATPAAVQSTVTCAATASTATTVTVTLTDSSGATTSVSSPLTFSTGSARPVTLAIAAANQSSADGPTASVCTGAPFGLSATVVDVASGSPVKGLAVSFKKQSGGVLGSLGNIVSSVLGVSGLNPSITTTTSFTAATAAGAVYAAGTSPTLDAVPGTCATTLTAAADKLSTYYGDPVVVTGRVTRVVAGRTIGVGGLAVPVRQTVVGTTTKVTTLATATTTADGTYAVTVKPVASGALTAEIPGSTAYAARSTSIGTAQVAVPATTLTGAVSADDVGFGTPVTVSGQLNRVAGSSTTGIKGSVAVMVTAPGKAAVRIGSATASTTGAYSVAVPLKISGVLSVVYAGAAGQPAVTTVVGPVTAGTWTTQLTAAASSTSIGLGGTTTLTGTVTKTYGGRTLPAPALRISFFFVPGGSTTRSLLGSATTTTAGTFSARVAPKSSGVLSLLLAAVPGYTEASGGPFPITVS